MLAYNIALNEGQRKFWGEGKGVQKEAISEGWVGFYLGLIVLGEKSPSGLATRFLGGVRYVCLYVTEYFDK